MTAHANAIAENGNRPERRLDCFDLVAAFGELLHASATGANYLVDILPTLF